MKWNELSSSNQLFSGKIVFSINWDIIWFAIIFCTLLSMWYIHAVCSIYSQTAYFLTRFYVQNITLLHLSNTFQCWWCWTQSWWKIQLIQDIVISYTRQTACSVSLFLKRKSCCIFMWYSCLVLRYPS